MDRTVLSSETVGTYFDRMVLPHVAVYRQVLSMLAYPGTELCSDIRREVLHRLEILEAEAIGGAVASMWARTDREKV